MQLSERSRANYHSWPEISKTQLSDFYGREEVPLKDGEVVRCWNRERYHKINIEKSLERLKKTRPMEIGSIIHEILLLGADPADICAVYPDVCYSHDGGLSGSTAKKFRRMAKGETCVMIPNEFSIKSGNGVSAKKPAQEWLAKQKARDPEILLLQPEIWQDFSQAIRKTPVEYVVKADEMNNIIGAVEAVRRSEVGKWIDASYLEEPLIWNETVLSDAGEHTFAFRCCPDFDVETDERVLSFDLKVTPATHPAAFRTKVKQFQYWLQDAHYSTGLQMKYQKPVDYRFVCVDPEPPHQVSILHLCPHSREQAMIERKELLEALAKCYITNDWSDPWTTQSAPITLSQWDF